MPSYGNLFQNVLSLSPAFISSKLNMRKNLYEHNKTQQLRHKLDKFPDICGGNGPSPHPPIQQVPDVLSWIEIRALRWPWQNTDIPVLQEIPHRTSSMAGGIVMPGWVMSGSCQDEPAGRVPHEGGGFPPCNAQR